MSTATLKHMDSMLPWDDLPADRQRKQRITILMLLLAFVMSVSIPFIKVPKQSRAEAEAVPERIARVVERKVELPPPPPPPPPKEEPKPEEKPTIEEKVVKPTEAPKPVEVVKAREKASQMLQEAGLDDIASMRDAFDMPAPAGGLITSTQEAGTSRSLLTSKAGSGSGMSSGSYGGQMSSGLGGKPAGKGTTAALGAGGNAKLQSVQSGIGAAAAAQAASRVGKDGKARRTTEDIRKVLDRYGARLNNLYQRALRDDPTMQGTVVLKLTVAPDGSVTSAAVQSSQLNNPDLESKIVALVRGFNFGAMEVETWSGPIDVNFMPQ